MIAPLLLLVIPLICAQTTPLDAVTTQIVDEMDQYVKSGEAIPSSISEKLGNKYFKQAALTQQEKLNIAYKTAQSLVNSRMASKTIEGDSLKELGVFAEVKRDMNYYVSLADYVSKGYNYAQAALADLYKMNEVEIRSFLSSFKQYALKNASPANSPNQIGVAKRSSLSLNDLSRNTQDAFGLYNYLMVRQIKGYMSGQLPLPNYAITAAFILGLTSATYPEMNRDSQLSFTLGLMFNINSVQFSKQQVPIH